MVKKRLGNTALKKNPLFFQIIFRVFEMVQSVAGVCQRANVGLSKQVEQ